MRGFSKAGRERSGLPELALSSGPRAALPCAGGCRKPAFLPVLRHLPAPTARAAPGPSVRPLLNHILSLLLFSRRPTPRAFAAAPVPPGRPSPICPHTPGTGDNACHTDGLEQLFGGGGKRGGGGRAGGEVRGLPSSGRQCRSLGSRVAAPAGVGPARLGLVTWKVGIVMDGLGAGSVGSK